MREKGSLRIMTPEISSSRLPEQPVLAYPE